MAVALPLIALASLAVTGVTTGLQIAEQAKQKKLQKRQARAAQAQAEAERERQRIEQVRADVAAKKERRQQLRELRLRRAQVLASAALSGGLGSSTTEGALGSLGSQFGSNIGAIGEAQGFGQAISTQNQAAADQATEINRLQGKVIASQGRQGMFQSIGNLASSTFDRAGGFTTLSGGNIFSRE